MWKYVTCYLNHTLQRGAAACNYFDARYGVGLASKQQTCVVPRKENHLKEYQETHKCNGDSGGKNTEKNEFNWRECHNLYSWINAFTWSGALAFGWYASNKNRHPIIDDPNFKNKCFRKFSCKRAFEKPDIKRKWFRRCGFPRSRCIQSAISQFKFTPSKYNEDISSSNGFPRSKNFHPPVVSSVDFITHSYQNYHIGPQSVVNIVHNINNNVNDHKPENKPIQNEKSFENSLDEAVRGLTNVLSSVENRLGLAAIEGGDSRSGVEMLQSAAQRSNASAIYNLALCYQKGIGVKRNEKMAAELYQEAAALDHPAATYNLAVFHGQGRGGLKKNPKVAEELLHMAASKGQEDAIKALPNIYPSDKDTINVKTEVDLSNVHNAVSGNIDKDPYTPMHSFLNTIIGNSVKATFEKSKAVLIY